MIFMLSSWPMFWYIDRVSNVLEVYANDVPVWSKNENGRLPTLDDSDTMLQTFIDY